MPTRDQSGFSLVELMIVLVVIGILAAIGIPRLLLQRQTANDATATSDLRNLISVEVGLEVVSGLSSDAAELAAQGWAVTEPGVTVCAELLGATDIVLTAWHDRGSKIYTYQRSAGRIESADVPLPADCAAATGGSGVEVS